jgi:hypothetical protein
MHRPRRGPVEALASFARFSHRGATLARASPDVRVVKEPSRLGGPPTSIVQRVAILECEQNEDAAFPRWGGCAAGEASAVAIAGRRSIWDDPGANRDEFQSVDKEEADMKSITDTFVLIAPDCPASAGTAPATKGPAPTIAVVQYELLTANPYTLTLEELIFATHVRRAGLSAEEAKARATEIRSVLFAKPHPCMRASPLPKRHGWGVHHDAEGRIAIYGAETDVYRRFAGGSVEGVAVVAAMRTKRAG